MKIGTALFLLPAMCTFGLGAQPLSIGVKGGVILTEPARIQDESRRYVVGPSFELRLPARFTFEVNALYRRIGSDIVYPTLFLPELSSPFLVNRLRGNSWEVPVLGKFHFRSQKAAWQPFLGTGYAFRMTWFESRGQSTFPDATDNTLRTIQFDNRYRSGLDVGAVFAAGVRLKAGRIAVVPEFRYTRWGSADNTIRKNDTVFLLGVHLLGSKPGDR
jgi:hypothetical protein